MKYSLFFILSIISSFSFFALDAAYASDTEFTFKWYACEVTRELPDQVVISDSGHPLFKAFHPSEENLVGYQLENLVNKAAVEFLRFDKITMTKNVLIPLQAYFMAREKDYYRKYQNKKEFLIRYRGVFWGGDRPNACDWVLDFFILASKKSMVSKIHISDAIKWLVDKLEIQNELYYPKGEAPEVIHRSDEIVTNE